MALPGRQTSKNIILKKPLICNLQINMQTCMDYLFASDKPSQMDDSHSRHHTKDGDLLIRVYFVINSMFYCRWKNGVKAEKRGKP